MVRTRRKRRRLFNQRFTFVDAIIYVALALLAATMIIPFMNIVALSLSDYASALGNRSMLIPRNIQFDAYSILFNVEVYRSLILTAFVTVTGTILHVFVSLMAAYGLSKKDLPGRRFLITFVIFTFLFSGGLIPYYFIIKGLAIDNTIWVYILPGGVGAYSVVMMKNFLLRVSVSLQEAALIDGANHFRILLSIVIPLSKPILATLALFRGVGIWNNWFTAVLFVQDRRLYVIQNILREMIVESNMGVFGNVDLVSIFPESVKMAAIIIATVPIMCVYPFMQKYFVKGLFYGSVKE